jgi:hypothetical protein
MKRLKLKIGNGPYPTAFHQSCWSLLGASVFKGLRGKLGVVDPVTKDVLHWRGCGGHNI